jgi:transposase InsO family protein
MAEAFVKTFKRDYIYPARLESAEKVIKMLAEFFEDYNENAPHKGLKLKSPREYLRSVQL